MLLKLITAFAITTLILTQVSCGTKGGVPASERQVEEKPPTIWGMFRNNTNPNTSVQVNKYLWNASLDVLKFLPLKAADPFTGVLVTDWGRAPGSSETFRATVYIQDAALDARSLRVAIYKNVGGNAVPASADTIRRVENAILTRARQLRIAVERR